MRLIRHCLLLLLSLSITPAVAQAIRVVPLPANDLVYDPVTQRLWASVPGYAGERGGTLTAIDPETGSIGPSVPVASEPGQLAISDRGRTIYISLDGQQAVRRFDTVSGIAAEPFPLVGEGFQHVEDMAVAPGRAEAVVVSRMRVGLGTPRSTGCVLYVDGVPRPQVGREANALAFGASASRLYAHHFETSGHYLARWSLDDTGIAGGDTIGVGEGAAGHIHYDRGRLFPTSGFVHDPETAIWLGTVPEGLPLTDASGRRVHILQTTGLSARLFTYDANTFFKYGEIALEGVRGTVGGMVRWGTDGLAFRTSDGRIFVIRTNQIAAQPADLSLTLSTAGATAGMELVGTVSVSPPAPPGGLVLSLSGDPEAVSLPSTVSIPEGETESSFPVVPRSVSVTKAIAITASGSIGAASAFLQALPNVLHDGNLLVNGSFEEPNTEDTRYPWKYTYGPQPYRLYDRHLNSHIPGWQISRGTVDLWYKVYHLPFDGRQYLDLVGSPGQATIQQSFVTEPGVEYLLSGRTANITSSFERRVDFSIDGVRALRLGSRGEGFKGWEKIWPYFSHRFRATSRVTTLTVADASEGKPTWGVFLDDLAVTVAGAPTTVPTERHPMPPDGVAARLVSPIQIELTWNDRSDIEIGYVVSRRDGAEPWRFLARLGPDVTRFADVEVRAGHRYAYRVDAVSVWADARALEEPEVEVPAASLPAVSLLLSEPEGGRVIRLDAVSGRVLEAVGAGISTLKRMTGLALGPDGYLYVAQPYLAAIHRHNAWTGDFINSLVDPYQAVQPWGPIGLAFGPSGDLFVSSSGNHQIQRYSLSPGGFRGVFVPSETGGLREPHDLRFGPDGRLYVASHGSNSVLRFDGATGALIDAFVPPGSGGLRAPTGLAFGPTGDLFVSSDQSHSVLRFDGRSGAFAGEFVAPRAAGLDTPRGLLFGPDGSLLVASTGTNRVLRYDGVTGAFLGSFFSGSEKERPEWLLLVPTPPPPALPAPSGLKVRFGFPATATLTWVDNSTDETGFVIWLHSGDSEWRRIAVVGPNMTRFADPTLIPGPYYSYRVQAIRGELLSEFAYAPAERTCARPYAPGNLMAIAAQPYVRLSWTRETYGDTGTVTEVYRRDGLGAEVLIARLPRTRLDYRDEDVRAGVRYTYRVRVVNDVFPSDWTNEAMVTLP